jgi:hypothetical protein
MDLDRIMGSAIKDLAQALDLCADINDMLLDGNRAFTITSDAGAFTSGKLTDLGYDGDDITLIAQAFGALAQLRLVALGQATVPAASNFFFQAQQLMGVTPL